MKCKMCGKEITRTDRPCYCSIECSERRNNIYVNIKSLIKRIRKKYNFDVQNEEKIINAKILLFKDSDVKKCPCDADNPERYCGSALCIHDVVEFGHCRCNLFHKKILAKDEK